MQQPFASVILTRPSAASEAFLAPFRKEWPEGSVDWIVSPLLEIVPTGTRAKVGDASGVIFSSTNAVNYAGEGRGKPAYCVGAATTRAAKEAGWAASCRGETAQELIDSLTQSQIKGPLVHLAGVHIRRDISAELTDVGIQTHTQTLYDQRLVDLSDRAVEALDRGIPAIVPLFSPRTARQFATKARGRSPLYLLGISEAVLAETATLDARGASTVSSPTACLMAAALTKLLRRVEAGGAAQ